MRPKTSRIYRTDGELRTVQASEGEPRNDKEKGNAE